MATLVHAVNRTKAPHIVTDHEGVFREVDPGKGIDIPYETARRWLRSRDWKIDLSTYPIRSFADGYLTYSSAVNTASGYGKQGYYILRNLIRSGLHVTYHPLAGHLVPTLAHVDQQTRAVIERTDTEITDWGLCHSVVDPVDEMPTDNVIAWTMWEADCIPDDRPSGPYNNWTDKLNRHCKALIVPSTEQKSVFVENSGVRIPTYVVHDAIDTDKWTFRGRRPRSDRPFTFASWSFMNSRKAPWETINAFLSAFGPDNQDVRLVMKTVNHMFGQGRFGVPKLPWPNVTIIDENWPEDRLLDFVQHEVDAGIFLSRGEGFYDPPLEALATGLPVIVSDHSGPHDYCLEGGERMGIYPVRLKGMTPAPQGPNMRWWLSDYDHAIHLMRQVYDDYPRALRRAEAGSRWVAKRWGIEHQRHDLMRVLKEITR